MLPLHAELKRVECVAVSPDGTRLAVGGAGLEVWAVPAFEPVWRWELPGDPMRSVTFGPDSRSVFGFIPNSAVRVYDSETGGEGVLWSPDPENLPRLWAVHPDRDRIFAATRPGSLCWRVRPSPRPGLPGAAVAWAQHSADTVGAAAFLPHRPALVTLVGRGNVAAGQSQHALRVLDPQTGEHVFTTRSGFAHADEVAVSPDGARLVARIGPALLVWDTGHLNLPPKRVPNDSPRQLTGLAFHPSGRWLATAGNDKTIKLWDVETWRVARSFGWAAGRMRSIAFAPDGLTAVAGGEGGEFVVFDVDV